MNIHEHSWTFAFRIVHECSGSFVIVRDRSWSFVIVRDRSWSFVIVRDRSEYFIYLFNWLSIYFWNNSNIEIMKIYYMPWILFMINSTRAFDWFMNCHMWLRKSFGSFCRLMGTLTKKQSKIFSHPDMRIYRAFVELIRNMLFLIFFTVIFGLKKTKNRVKIRNFKLHF